MNTTVDREKKNRQKTFFWLLKNCKDFSKYHSHSYGEFEKLPKINDEFIDEGPCYGACTEFLDKSTISFSGKTWKIKKAMAPIHVKKMVENGERLKKTDHILLFLTDTSGTSKKYLLNVHGDILPCASEHPCDSCGYYSTIASSCQMCITIEQEERDEYRSEWKNVNNQMFEAHKHMIPKEFHFMYRMEDDPSMQCIFLANMLSLSMDLEKNKKEKDKAIEDKRQEEKLFSEDDFPPLK